MKGKKLISLCMSVTMLPLTFGIASPSPVLAAGEGATNVVLNPSDASPFNGGKFEGWGTSLCWWANRLGYSEKLTQQAADAFFADSGLGLDIGRYNIGGGDNPAHNHITRSDSIVPGYWGSFEMSDDGKDVDITYDWTKDENQRNIALAAQAANPDIYFEGFSNSPPYFMTNSNCSSGAEDANTDNLKTDMYDDFAKYIADTTKHFKDEFGITFKSYSPMNEPDTNYWGALSPKQEGCHFDPGTSQSNMIIETRKALDAAGLSDVLVAGMDETSIDKTVSNLDKLTADAKTALGRIDTHTYSGSKRFELKAKAQSMGKNLWMSEVDGGWDGFGLARRIIDDMNGMQPAAWIMWDIVDVHRDSSFTDPNGNHSEANASVSDTSSLWGVAMANHDTETLVLTNKYYAFGQFTKYINPGDTIIASSNDTLAAYNKETGDIKIVALNSSSNAKSYVFDISAFTNVGTSVKEIRTSNSGEKWANITSGTTLANKKITTTLKAQSVTTFVIEGNGPSGYALITGGGEEIALGDSISLALATDIELTDDVVWSVSDTNLASVTQDGIVTALKSGTVTVYAVSGDITAEKTFVIPMYKITGTASWGNDSSAPADSADYTKVADGDMETFFDGTQGGWVMYDYGAPFTVNEIRLAARSGNSMPERTAGGVVQGSNDGINWTDLYKLTSYIPSGVYTVITPAMLADTKAYRYFRYTNNENMANIAEFLIDGTLCTDVQAGEPVITDLDEFTDNFESTSNIFSALSGTLASDGTQVYESGLDRFGNVLMPVKSTAVTELAEAVTLTDKDRFRLKFNMFSGWENNGKDNTFALKDGLGNEIVAIYLTGGGYTLNQVRIGGTNVLDTTKIAQSRSNPGTGSKAGANGWNASGQPYRNTVGYNKSVEIIIDGTGAVTVSTTGGMEDTTVTGMLSDPVTIKSIELTGSYNSARERVVSYDNFDGDIITYAEPLKEPEPVVTPEPTDAPVVPDNGELINLSFDNGDLTSSSSYGKAEGTPVFTTVDGKKCVQFNNTASTAINLTDANGNALLTGMDEITISFKAKPTSTNASWLFYASPNANTQTYQQEKYLGALSQNGALTVERYNNSGSRPASASGALTVNEWNDILIIVKNGITELYINGAKSEQASSYKLSDLLGKSSVAYIGRANWVNGEYASGYMDDFVIYNYAMTVPEIDLGDLSAVVSDITLPTALEDGSTVKWESSDASVITNNGKVTRPENGSVDVVIKATIMTDTHTISKEFKATVIGKTAVADTFTAYAENGTVKFTSSYGDVTPYDMYVALHNTDGTLVELKKNVFSGSFDVNNGTYKISCYLWDGATPKHELVSKTVNVAPEQEMGAYLFTHFVGTESNAQSEQVYFSVSQNGTDWTTLNNNTPILTSNVGELGVRDPHIIRGVDGKFFIISTDLSIYNRRDDSNRWGTCQTSGSKNIVIWESDDLVNWSNARAVKVAKDNAGCTWAPEAVYDAEKDMYMVFWASKTADDNYATQRMYRSYTKDFVTFTEPEIYIDGGTVSNIDTTITSHKGVYYRFTKNESNSSVTMMKSTSLDKGWTMVDSYTLGTMTGYEGPTIYKLNGEDKWCLLLDNYAASAGYKPFVTDDIAKGSFAAASDFNFSSKYRHGTVIPITAEEYERLVEAY